jgi:hypothetical protein
MTMTCRVSVLLTCVLALALPLAMSCGGEDTEFDDNDNGEADPEPDGDSDPDDGTDPDDDGDGEPGSGTELLPRVDGGVDTAAFNAALEQLVANIDGFVDCESPDLDESEKQLCELRDMVVDMFYGEPANAEEQEVIEKCQDKTMDEINDYNEAAAAGDSFKQLTSAAGLFFDIRRCYNNWTELQAEQEGTTQ